MDIGKEIRLRRFIDSSNKTLIMPLDHGVEGVFGKFSDMGNFINQLADKSDAFILRKGTVKNSYKNLINKSSIIQLLRNQNFQHMNAFLLHWRKQ